MNGNEKNKSDFSEIVKKAYEKGEKENGITLSDLIEDLKAELKHLLVS